jgi:CDP-glucose 4,6-dehydratase
MSYRTDSLHGAFSGAFAGKRVFVTGHTGFKGSWLCQWLLACGADVSGYALEPVTRPSLFEQLGLSSGVEHTIADVRDGQRLADAVTAFQPDFVFHLAAQPLVVASYEEPRLTFETNVLGTVNLLEALRGLRNPCIGILVTSDKCYRNDESGEPFKETDALGGDDPYSASKGAMEVVLHSYRKSFFLDGPVRLASVRAGNVIGGGDYADDRIIPDCVRSLSRGNPIRVRNPAHTRPFQHVMEPLSGYLWLAKCMADGWVDPDGLYAFNFGPAGDGHRSVQDLVEAVLECWPGKWESTAQGDSPSESGKLALSINRARELLTWEPRWSFKETVEETVRWYREASQLAPEDTAGHVALTKQTIQNFIQTHA